MLWNSSYSTTYQYTDFLWLTHEDKRREQFDKKLIS